MLKTYIALTSCYFATDIVGTDGKVIARIAFDGGVRYPKPVNGIFVTPNKELQNAIEKDASFDVLFKLLRTDGTEEVAAKPVIELPPAGTEYPEIITVGSARLFLMDTFARKAANRAEVFAVAAELGIAFPNLPLE